MRRSKIIFAALTASALLAASVTTADARGFRHRGPGPILGLLGGVIVGAATIATLPFAVLADATRPAPPPGYYDRGYYGPPPPPPPPRYYRQYGPPPGYYGYGY